MTTLSSHRRKTNRKMRIKILPLLTMESRWKHVIHLTFTFTYKNYSSAYITKADCYMSGRKGWPQRNSSEFFLPGEELPPT
jgi:hypothetical protein